MIEIFANEESPKALGFAMPPWRSVQESVFLSWPSNPQTWPAYSAERRRHMRLLPLRFPDMNGCALSAPHRSLTASTMRLRDANACFERIELLDIPTNDAWCRDHGPIFVKNPQTGERAVLDFTYNAWGGKFPPWDKAQCGSPACCGIFQSPAFSNSVCLRRGCA